MCVFVFVFVFMFDCERMGAASQAGGRYLWGCVVENEWVGGVVTCGSTKNLALLFSSFFVR